ncbi:uncharacterized protein LOC127262046 isoform X4 [Andrographis paniculata]|uniref:uncharacterized protein LOC127262046 isoform X4 n=1 Tax=Andrographis paniculata TaxID=175694 RepID=UPI0021E7E042|nr:uncharacterized protein LOC127262046 isoform X4 [Andrographis paniculata]
MFVRSWRIGSGLVQEFHAKNLLLRSWWRDDRLRRRRGSPGASNNPLYIQSFTEADDALKLHHIVHCSLDAVDERVNNPKKSGPILNEAFLGLLYPTEKYKVYGYLTNTKVKFIFVTTDLDVRDADVRNFQIPSMFQIKR